MFKLNMDVKRMGVKLEDPESSDLAAESCQSRERRVVAADLGAKMTARRSPHTAFSLANGKLWLATHLRREGRPGRSLSIVLWLYELPILVSSRPMSLLPAVSLTTAPENHRI